MSHKIRRIEISFPEPVDVPDKLFQDIVGIASKICDGYEVAHPGRVMWPFEIGSKLTYVPMTQEEEKTRGLEFDDDTLAIVCYEREDYSDEEKHG